MSARRGPPTVPRSASGWQPRRSPPEDTKPALTCQVITSQLLSAHIKGPGLQGAGPAIPLAGEGDDLRRVAVERVEQRKAYLRTGELRFVVTGGEPGGAIPGGSAGTQASISRWVTQACTPVQLEGTDRGGLNLIGATLYDCADAPD